MCETIVESSIKIWAAAVENYYEKIDKESVNTIIPHTKCSNLSQIETNQLKYHYGKSFHK